MAETDTITSYNNPKLIGHVGCLENIQRMRANNVLPNAFLISGPKGSGKATLAQHAIWSILSGKSGAIADHTHTIPTSDILWNKMAHQSHPDLRVLQANTLDDKGKVKKDITIDAVRTIQHFLHHTSTETDYRIVLIDSADDMNVNAANALLKLLEEPPQNALFVLVSHLPSTLLPTIKSRCHQIKIAPLQEDDSNRVVASLLPDVSSEEWQSILPIVQYSPGRAVEYYQLGASELYQQLINFLANNQRASIEQQQSLVANVLANKDQAVVQWRYFLLGVQYLLRCAIMQECNAVSGLAVSSGEQAAISRLSSKTEVEKLMDLWNKIVLLEQEALHLNLDKRLVLTNICEMLKR
jgi:DNA polymerase-3 subunit delta'